MSVTCFDLVVACTKTTHYLPSALFWLACGLTLYIHSRFLCCVSSTFAWLCACVQEAEEARCTLLELQAVAAAVESSGQSKAEAQARAERLLIEGQSAIECEATLTPPLS